MNKNLYLSVNEELYKLTGDKKYLKEFFIERNAIKRTFKDQNTLNQFSTLAEIAKDQDGPFNTAIEDWEVNSPLWQKALNLAKKNELKVNGNDSNGNQEQIVLKITNLQEVNSNRDLQPVSGYLKLNLNDSGKLNKEGGWFKTWVRTRGYKLNSNLFTLTNDRDEATYLSKDDASYFNTLFNDLSRKKGADKFKTDQANQGEYYISQNTALTQERMSSNNIKIQGAVNSDFVIQTYITKRVGNLNLSQLLNDNNADNKILTVAKQIDTSGIIKKNLNDASDITKCLIFEVLDNVKKYSIDSKEIGQTLNTINKLTLNSDLDMNLNSFLDTKKFSTNLAISGILNNAEGGIGNSAAGYERIVKERIYWSEKLKVAMEKYDWLTEFKLRHWLTLEECDSKNSNKILETLRDYCIGKINLEQLNDNISEANDFVITTSNAKTCKLRNLDTCNEYWKLFTDNEDNETFDEGFKLYIGKEFYPVKKIDTNNTYQVKRSDYQNIMKLTSPNNFFTIGKNSKNLLKINTDLKTLLTKVKENKDEDWKLITDYFKKVEQNTRLVGNENSELKFKTLTFQLDPKTDIIQKISITDVIVPKAFNKEIKTDDQEQEKEQEKEQNQEKEKTTSEYIKVKVDQDKKEYIYKASPNKKIYYRQNIRGDQISYIIKLQDNIYAKLNRNDALKIDSKLPSEEDIRKDEKLSLQAKGRVVQI